MGPLKFKMVQMSHTWRKYKVTLSFFLCLPSQVNSKLDLLYFLSQQCGLATDLRPHVEQVPHGHVGVALAVAVALCEELVLGPGHVNPLRTRFRLVVDGGVGRRVPVVDELRLEGRRRKRGEEENFTSGNKHRKHDDGGFGRGGSSRKE